MNTQKFTDEEMAIWQRIDTAQRQRRAAAARRDGQRPLPVDDVEMATARPRRGNTQRPPQPQRRPEPPTYVEISQEEYERRMAARPPQQQRPERRIDGRQVLTYTLLLLLLFGAGAPLLLPAPPLGMWLYLGGMVLIAGSAAYLMMRATMWGGRYVRR